MTNRIYIANWSEQAFNLAMAYSLGIEIQNFCSPTNIDSYKPIVENLEKNVATIGMRALHGPFSELVPASRDPLIREVTKARFNSAYNIAHHFNAKHLILHTGYIPKTYLSKDWLNASIQFWQDFLSDKTGNIEVHIENVYEDDFSLIDALINEIGINNLSVCIDIGHVHANSTKPLDLWIRSLNNKIRYVHLHNNDGIFDDHFGFWKGKIDMVKTLDLLKVYAPNADWSIETRAEDIEQSIKWLKSNNYI